MHLTQCDDMVILPGVEVVHQHNEGKISSGAAQSNLDCELYVKDKAGTAVLGCVEKAS